MKRQLLAVATVTSITTAVIFTASCIGPFAKKSSSSSGGGGSTPVKKATDSGSGSGATTTSTSGTTTTGTTTTGTSTGGDPVQASANSSAKDGYGCLQGLVVNGYTGQPIDLSKMAAPEGIYALDHGAKIVGGTITGDTNLVGQYYICGLPLDSTYPVFVFMNGFLPFQTTTTIHGTRALDVGEASNSVVAEAKKLDPLNTSNVVLWPVGNSDRALKVHIVHNGSGYAGALVDAEPIAASEHFSFAGTFAESTDDYLLPIRVTTDSDGWATFDAGKLSLGHRYSIAVTPKSGDDLASAAAGPFTFGIDGTAVANSQNNYELTVNLTSANTAISIVSCSQEYSTYSTNGSISFIFNRDISGPVDANLMKATLSGAGIQAVQQADDPSNTVSEQVQFSYSNRKLILSPIWTNGTQPKTPDPSKVASDSQNADKDLTIAYDLSKINVKVVGDLDVNMKALSTIAKPGVCNGTTRFFPELF